MLMQHFHYVFKLVFQLFHISLAELLLQISCLSFFLGFSRQPGVLEFPLLALTSLIGSSHQVLKTFFFEFSLIFKVSRKLKRQNSTYIWDPWM